MHIRRVSAYQDLPLPSYQSETASGMDLYAAIEAELVVEPGGRVIVPCGFALALPYGVEAQVRPRSGLAAAHGLSVLNAPGTIDSDYRGEVKVILINHGSASFRITRGMRIAQLVIAPVLQIEWVEAEDLPPTSRGEKGYGHTGH